MTYFDVVNNLIKEISAYLRKSHRPFKAAYKTQIYSLHQNGTSLSDEAVAPSQYDLSCWVDVRTQIQQHQTRLDLNILTHCCYSYSYCILFQFFFAFCFSFLCSFLKRKVVEHVAYLLRPTLVHIGIEGGSTAGSRDNGHTSIYFHSFSCPP